MVNVAIFLFHLKTMHDFKGSVATFPHQYTQ